MNWMLVQAELLGGPRTTVLGSPPHTETASALPGPVNAAAWMRGRKVAVQALEHFCFGAAVLREEPPEASS